MESGLLRLGKDVIPPFSGEGDVVGWIKKVELVAKLPKSARPCEFHSTLSA